MIPKDVVYKETRRQLDDVYAFIRTLDTEQEREEAALGFASWVSDRLGGIFKIPLFGAMLKKALQKQIIRIVK